jgi:hypothetical protein
MKNLICSNDNSIEPNGAIGIQTCGIIFWQKTGFLRRCNELGFQTIIELVKRKFAPTSVQKGENCFFLTFDNDDKKIIFVSLKQEKKSKHHFIYGESHTAYTDVDFHIFALNFVSYISRQIGCKFYVNDATGYLENRSDEQLEKYIKKYLCIKTEWRHVVTGFDGNVTLFDVNIFEYQWKSTGETIEVLDPLYKQPHTMCVYKVLIGEEEHEFAAGEFSNCVWGFYTRE